MKRSTHFTQGSMRCCPYCRMPGEPTHCHPGAIYGIGVLLGACARCVRANRRLPAGTRQKRLNAAAKLAASDTTGRYWTARFSDPDAALLAAGLLSNPRTTAAALSALGWR